MCNGWVIALIFLYNNLLGPSNTRTGKLHAATYELRFLFFDRLKFRAERERRKAEKKKRLAHLAPTNLVADVKHRIADEKKVVGVADGLEKGETRSVEGSGRQDQLVAQNQRGKGAASRRAVDDGFLCYVDGIQTTIEGADNLLREGDEHAETAAESANAVNDLTSLWNRNLAQRLKKRKVKRSAPPVFWVLTAPENEDSRVLEILTSWGSLVKELVFWGTSFDKTVKTVEQSIQFRVGRDFISDKRLPLKSKARKEFHGWLHIAEEYLSLCNGPEGVDSKSCPGFFVKADDDTMWLVDTLVSYLASLDPDLPYYLGQRFVLGGSLWKPQYASGGAGYVLSRKALAMFVAQVPLCLTEIEGEAEGYHAMGIGDLSMPRDPSSNVKDGNSERKAIIPGIVTFGDVHPGDLLMGLCLQSAGIFPEDTRDLYGRHRFHAFTLEHHTMYENSADEDFWYSSFVYGPLHEGQDCCDTNTTVSFHYMEGKMR